MALRQQPDHVVVPRLANVRARPITLFQLLNAEMILHVRHARPLRFIAHQANCFAPPRESADSISRKPYYSFFLADQLQVLGYPISGADDELRPGHRRYNWGWYRVARPEELKVLCTDDFGQQHEFSVPPPLVRKDLIAQMRADAEALLPPQYLDCLHHIDQPFLTPVYDF